MIEKPEIPDEIILRGLQEFYGVRGAALEFIPHGLDSHAWAYRVEALGGRFFLKVNRGSVPEAGAWMPAFLAQRGVKHVIPALPTSDGGLVARVGDLSLRLQPFVEARRGLDGGLSSATWTEFGAFLRTLHTLDTSFVAGAPLAREDYHSRRWHRVASLNAWVEAGEHADAIVMSLVDFWRGRRDAVAEVLARNRDLGKSVRGSPHEMVLCHADIHTANLLVTGDEDFYAVDWDDAKLAPRERDLVFVLAEAEAADLASFARGYGDAGVDPFMLAYYQNALCVEDIGAFAEEVLDVTASRAARWNSLGWFKSMFAEGNAVTKALSIPSAVRA